MKKIISILIALMMSTQLFASADTEYIPKGLIASQEYYADIISVAIENSEYKEEQIDKEHIFVVEHTSPIPMRKGEDAIWLYVALPIIDSTDISYAHFDKGKYVMATTNFVSFKGMESPCDYKLQEYIEENNLSEPTKITNVWVGERVHVFAYKVNCDNEEYIIPYYFTEYTLFNLTDDEECNIEIGKAYTMDEFLDICEKEAELFTEYRKSEREQERENNSYTYVDDNGDVVTTKPKKEEAQSDKPKDEEKLSGGDPAYVYDFEELTGLSREDVDHIVIRSGVDGVGYSTAYDKIISEVYNAINTKSFNVYIKDGNSGGWRYQILFFDKNNSAHTYTISTGIVVKEKDGLTYRTSNEEELKNVVEKAYNLIANDCSNWAADYIVKAKDLGFLADVEDVSYKEPVTREKFCEIIYNMLDKTTDIEWKKVSPNPFIDTTNEKVFSLCLEGIVNGKGGYNFAPNDYLTREEAATIIDRVYKKGFLIGKGTTAQWLKFEDESKISQWALYGVQNACKQGIMNGTGDGSFSPKGIYTAEQAITSAVRMYENK